MDAQGRPEPPLTAVDRERIPINIANMKRLKDELDREAEANDPTDAEVQLLLSRYHRDATLQAKLRGCILCGMWEGPERRSRASRLARALVTVKREADQFEDELDDVPRWRRLRRSELKEARDGLRARERELLGALGSRG